jgi:hypothetical protein
MTNLNDTELTPSEEPEKEERKKPKYVSKEGFEKVLVFRGFTEIEQLHNELKKEIKRDAFICGGYVRYMCSPRHDPSPASDVDIYCMNEEVFEKVKKLFKRTDIALTIKHENDISITYQRPTSSDHPFFASPPIQLIKPLKEGRVVSFGSMEEILTNFDFTVIRAGLLDHTLALVDADFIHDEGARILRLKNIHCPISSTLRCMKYARKGYWLPPFNCLKLFLDWDERDADYRAKLVEFLALANNGEGLTQKDIDELEALMRID